MADSEKYEFGEFVLDAAERRLSKGSRNVPLEPRALDVLLTLVRRAGKLVTRGELLELVWPQTHVEEGILSVYISVLRKALRNGDGSPRAIETVSRSGYRFSLELTRQPNADRGEDGRRESSSHRSRPEVYELFGHGRACLLKMSMFDVPKAVEAFQSAIELDPSYAAAHAGMALARCAQAQLRLSPPAEAYAAAKTAALRALAMDSACADAQAALGAVLFFSEWNWAGAQKSLERALELNPSHTEALLLYGQLLDALGQLDAGLATKRKALERDPFSPQVHLQISMSYWNQFRYDDAIEWANKALELDPRHPHAREFLAGAYWKKGDFDRYLSENIRHAELHGAPPEALAPLKQAYSASGAPGVRALILQRISSHPQAFPAMQAAIVYGEAGNRDTAFEYLDRAIESQDPGLVYLAVGPQWDALRLDRRFAECVARMGLTPVPRTA
jgi:DNA-binding winged helix-turn-helix (wHTH) protein/Tfp pilus assembly protein PilF